MDNPIQVKMYLAGSCGELDRCTSIDEGRVNPWVHTPHIPTNAEIEESINRWEDEMAAMAPDLWSGL